jgi:hypothetical protein
MKARPQDKNSMWLVLRLQLLSELLLMISDDKGVGSVLQNLGCGRDRYGEILASTKQIGGRSA